MIAGQTLVQSKASNILTQPTFQKNTLDDDDYITTTTDTLESMAMANNANKQLTRDKVSKLRHELAAIRSIMSAGTQNSMEN